MTRRRRIETVQGLLEEVKRRTILWVIFVCGLAYLFSLTSKSMFLNVPVAMLILAAIGYLSFDLEIRKRADARHVPSHLSHLLKHQLSFDDPLLSSPPVSTRWRRKIDSPLVESSIDNFSRRIVQEFVTDLWFASLSPDQDVPQQIQALINDIFGEIAQRVKRINLISLLTRDLVDLVGSHLELFRQTKAGVKHFEALSTEAREENLKLVLKKVNKLHPALLSPESECKVLQQLMSGVVAILLRPQDAQCALLRGLARELLACAVLRPVMNLASPGFINKTIEQATSAKDKLQGNKAEKGATDGSSSGKNSRGGSSRPSKGAEDESKSEHNREDSRLSMVLTEPLGKQGDWAQVLEVVSKRRTTTLAPENLDNLWAKGRNYKKRDLERALVKPNQTVTVSVPPRTSGEIPQRLSVEKNQLKPAVKGAYGSSSTPHKTNQDLLSGFDGKTRSRSSEMPKVEKLALNNSLHGYGSSHGEGVHNSALQMTAAEHTSEEEKLFDEPLGIELHYPQSKNSNSGLDGWQKLPKLPINQDGTLNYWDNPGIRLSTGSVQHDQVADWLNDPDGLGGQNIAHSPAFKLNCWVVGAHLEKMSSKTFAVYSIAVTDSDNNTWFVERRFRNFEQLHRNLRDLPQYNLQLPPKRILSSSLDDAFVRDRCILLDKYLKDLLSIPSIAELHEVWDFLSINSKKYSFTKSASVMKIIAVNVDDAVDDMVRQLKGVSDGIFRQLGAPSSPSREGAFLSSTVDPFKRTSSSEAPPASYLTQFERERSEQFSDDESGGHLDEEGALLLEGWHSDSELPDSRTSVLSQRHGLEYDKNDQETKKRIKRVGSDLLPDESVAGSEVVDDDLGVPPEWTPPKVTLPLLNLVDGVFQLQRRGWLRRQVFWMGKQILQLGMGDAVDDWLVTKVRWLRREDVVASSIRWLQEILWPGGVFITKTKKDDNASALNSPSRQGSKQMLQKGLDQSAFFESQLEASRCAHVVHEVLVEGGPAALVSLVGKKQYTKCAKDIYYFLQSTVFLKQLTYSVLETLLAATFPELTRLIIDIRTGSGQVVI